MENQEIIRISENSNPNQKQEIVCESVTLLKGPNKTARHDTIPAPEPNPQPPNREQLAQTIWSDITDTKLQLGELHRKLLPKERQLLMKKEQTALEVSKYFSDLKLKVNQYLLEQEDKIQKELSQLTEKETQQLNQDVSQCCNLLENLDLKENELTLAKSSDISGTNDLHELKTSMSEYKHSCRQLKTLTEEPFEIRFMINTDLEDMFTNCNIVTIETISARHSISRQPERLNNTTVTSAENELEYADNVSGESQSDSGSDYSESSESLSDSDNESLEEDEETSAESNTGMQSTPNVQRRAQTRELVESEHFDQRPTHLRRITSQPSTMQTSSFEDEPPPPYPGLPEGFASMTSTSGGGAAQNTGQIQTPDIVVYPPQFGVNTPQATRYRSRSREGLSEMDSSLQASPSLSARPHSSDRRQLTEGAMVSSNSHRRTVSSSSLPENESATHAIKNPKVGIVLYPDIDNVDNIHPELRVPNSTDPSPSAPPLPFVQGSGSQNVTRPRRSTAEQRHEETQSSDNRNSTHSAKYRSDSSRYQRMTPATVDGGQTAVQPRRKKEHNAPFSFKFVLRTNTAIAADERPPGLVGMASLAEAYLVVVDRWNCKLKLIKNRVVKSVLLFGTFEPWDATTVSDTKCAVTVPKACEICFVARQGTKLKLEKRVSTARGYACLSYSRRDNSFVCGCCPQFGRPHVAIVSLDGVVLKIIRENDSREEIFSYPRTITVTEDDTIVVADNNKNSVIFLRLNGTFLNEYRGLRSGLLQDVQAVTALQYQRLVLVADSKANNIHVLTNSGRFRGVIQGGSDISNPRRLAVTALHQPQLLVAHGNGYVSVFDISWNM